jgi:hypothetical protein
MLDAVVDRAADDTDICLSLIFIICDGIDWFDSSGD